MSKPLHKACDACRSRKARCKMATTDACEFCLFRNSRCCFSHIKKPRKRMHVQTSERITRSRPLSNEVDVSQYGTFNASERLYIDLLLAGRQSSLLSESASKHPDQLLNIVGPNPNISFFPARRVRSINQRLGHNRLEQVLSEIGDIVSARAKTTSSIPRSKLFQERNLLNATHVGDRKPLNEHISVYFEVVHPIYPFLCKESFLRQARSPNIVQFLATDKAFAALYYAIVAIGCQHNEGGNFDAGFGEAWSYFERPISYFQDLIFFRGSLSAVQALMAMAIFSSTVPAFQFEPLMLSEAALMAQGLGYNRSNGLPDGENRRTFWVLYFMEKVSCFTSGRASVLQDSNISCPIPNVTESSFHDHDWLFSVLRYARLVTKIQESLLTISSVNQSDNEYNAKVQKLLTELETWRLSAPERFRAGEPMKPRLLHEPLAQTVALRTHYLYFSALLTLCWTLLNFSAGKLGTTQQHDLKRQLMRSAHSVLELTKFIEVAPSTPIWILAVLPLSCLMILFDIVVHNPDHPETSISLALLDIAAGHFSRLEFASMGTLPGSLIGQFAHLARQYVFENRHKTAGKTNNVHTRDPEPLRDENLEGPYVAAGIPTPSIDLSPTNAPMSTSHDHIPDLPEELLIDASNTVPEWNSASLPGTDRLFIPFIDDPSYRVGDLELLGIDLKDLFDNLYSIPDIESNV